MAHCRQRWVGVVGIYASIFIGDTGEFNAFDAIGISFTLHQGIWYGGGAYRRIKGNMRVSPSNIVSDSLYFGYTSLKKAKFW